jgi:hypothetical protein
MLVRRLVLASFLAATTAVATARPASAGPADDPNADVASNVLCEDGQVFETLIGTGVAGRVPSGPAVGVVKSLHVLLERGGDPVFTVFDRPGRGLDGKVVWCEWFNVTDGFLLGGEVLRTGAPDHRSGRSVGGYGSGRRPCSATPIPRRSTTPEPDSERRPHPGRPPQRPTDGRPGACFAR